MATERQLSDEGLQRLFDQVDADIERGSLDDARTGLAIGVAELLSRGVVRQYPLELLANLEVELGDTRRARAWLDAARTLAVEKQSALGVFRMDVQLAKLALCDSDVDSAEQTLAAIARELGGPPSVAASSSAAVLAWIRALRFEGFVVEIVRAETALVVAEMWSERGRYLAARAAVALAREQFPAAGAGVDRVEVDLLDAELAIAAGQFEEAKGILEQLPAELSSPTRLRVTTIKARVALLGGRLAEARTLLRSVVDPMGSPRMLTAITLARLALLSELNQFGEAMTVGARARQALVDAGAASAAVDRALAAIELRARSAIASWELPWVPDQLWSDADAAGLGGALDRERSGVRYSSRWRHELDSVFVALEKTDLAAAEEAVAKLQAATRDVESEYISARVKFASTLVRYYREGAARTHEELVAIAESHVSLGARLAAIQALRIASWAAARTGRQGDQVALARQSQRLVDTIASELAPADRVSFFLNRWSARDEYVAARMRQTLEGKSPSRRELLRLFREVDRLTSTTTDRGLEGQALDDPSLEVADDVAAWLARHLESSRKLRGCTPWRFLGLWRFPRATTLLHYHVLADRILLFRVARGRLDARILPIPRATIDAELAAVLRDIQDGLEGRVVDDRLARLAAWLAIDETLQLYPSTSRLAIVAHDVLTSVPFCALPLDGQRLCERVALIQLDRVQRMSRARSPRKPKNVVGVGIGAYEGTLRPLPQATEEVANVARWIGGTSLVLRDREATRPRILSALAEASHFHVAAHGVFVAGAPHESGIWVAGHEGFEKLTVADLRRVSARTLDVAVMASCWSAEIAQLPGREWICLPTALLDAGARSVVASIWEVDDEASARVLEPFFRRVVARGSAIALANAQAALAREKAPLRTWAGFVCYGNH